MDEYFFKLTWVSLDELAKVKNGDSIKLTKDVYGQYMAIGESNDVGIIGKIDTMYNSTINTFLDRSRKGDILINTIKNKTKTGALVHSLIMSPSEFEEYKTNPSRARIPILLPMTKQKKELLILSYYVNVDSEEEIDKMTKKYNSLFSDGIKEKYEIVNVVMPTNGESKVELLYSSEVPKEVIPSIDEFFQKKVVENKTN